MIGAWSSGYIDGFQVIVQRANMADQTRTVSLGLETNSGSSQLTVDGLTPGQQYTLEVKGTFRTATSANMFPTTFSTCETAHK